MRSSTYSTARAQLAIAWATSPARASLPSADLRQLSGSASATSRWAYTVARAVSTSGWLMPSNPATKPPSMRSSASAHTLIARSCAARPPSLRSISARSHASASSSPPAKAPMASGFTFPLAASSTSVLRLFR